MFGDTASTLSVVAAVVTALSFASILLAGVFFSSRSRGTKEALESLSETNKAMESALRFERAERVRDKEDCAREVAHLQGQIDAIQTKQMETLMTRVEGGMTTMVGTMLDRLEDGLQTAVVTAVATGVEAGVRAANDE